MSLLQALTTRVTTVCVVFFLLWGLNFLSVEKKQVPMNLRVKTWFKVGVKVQVRQVVVVVSLQEMDLSQCDAL